MKIRNYGVVVFALTAAALAGCARQPIATIQAKPTAASGASLDDAALARELAENDRIRRERATSLPAPRPVVKHSAPNIKRVRHQVAPVARRNRSDEDTGALSAEEWARASSENALAAETAPQIQFRSRGQVSSIEPESQPLFQGETAPAGRVYGANAFRQSRSRSGSTKRKSSKGRGYSRSGRGSHFSPKYGR